MDEEEEPCCEPFIFINGKCLISQEIDNESKLNNSGKQMKEIVQILGNNIIVDKRINDSEIEMKETVQILNDIKEADKQINDSEKRTEETVQILEGIRKDDKKINESEIQREDMVVVWNSIGGEQLPEAQKSGNIKLDESDNTLLNVTSIIHIGLNDTTVTNQATTNETMMESKTKTEAKTADISSFLPNFQLGFPKLIPDINIALPNPVSAVNLDTSSKPNVNTEKPPQNNAVGKKDKPRGKFHDI